MLGRLVAAVMVKETDDVNQRAIDRLGIEPGDRVLDVGAGNGASLSKLAARSGDGVAVGVSPEDGQGLVGPRRAGYAVWLSSPILRAVSR